MCINYATSLYVRLNLQDQNKARHFHFQTRQGKKRLGEHKVRQCLGNRWVSVIQSKHGYN